MSLKVILYFNKGEKDIQKKNVISFCLAGVAGFEPTHARIKILCLTAWRHPNDLVSLIWGDLRGSNPWPPVPQSGVLPTELRPPCVFVVLPKGFEPLTSALEGHCSIQLSYGSLMEQVKGIGPSQPAWKASVLPLNYTCTIVDYHNISQT